MDICFDRRLADWWLVDDGSATWRRHLWFCSMEAGDHNQPDSHPENKHGTHMEPLYIGFGDVWRCLESWVHGFHIYFLPGVHPPCSHLTRTLCGIAAVFIFGSAAARVSAPVSPDGPWPHPFCYSCRRSWISLFPRRAPCIGSISSCWDHGGGSRVRPCPVMSMLHPSPSPCPVMSMLHPSVSAFAFALSFCHGEF